jgi:hypothetical protein
MKWVNSIKKHYYLQAIKRFCVGFEMNYIAYYL